MKIEKLELLDSVSVIEHSAPRRFGNARNLKCAIREISDRNLKMTMGVEKLEFLDYVAGIAGEHARAEMCPEYKKPQFCDPRHFAF